MSSWAESAHALPVRNSLREPATLALAVWQPPLAKSDGQHTPHSRHEPRFKVHPVTSAPWLIQTRTLVGGLFFLEISFITHSQYYSMQRT